MRRNTIKSMGEVDNSFGQQKHLWVKIPGYCCSLDQVATLNGTCRILSAIHQAFVSIGPTSSHQLVKR